MGRINYGRDANGADETGWLLYLKSALLEDVNECIWEYRARHPDFPHETTADQLFDEAQFEAYRALGYHVAKTLFEEAPVPPMSPGGGTAGALLMDRWFEALADRLYVPLTLPYAGPKARPLPRAGKDVPGKAREVGK